MKKAKQTTENNSVKITLQEPKKNFIMIYDSVYKNNNLTIEEIGFLTKLIGTAPTFRKTKENFKKVLNISERKYLEITKGLKDKGYLKINKYGKSSEWIISQEPFINQLNDLTKESLISALMHYQLDLKGLKQLHKLKIIDDNLFNETATAYANEIIRIAKTPWLNNDDE